MAIKKGQKRKYLAIGIKQKQLMTLEKERKGGKGKY